MAYSWFRFYHEFATDPKIQMLSEVLQRRFVMLLCLRCCNGDGTLHETEVAFQLRISLDEWLSTKADLMDKNLIDGNGKPINWEKRQYKSDTSTDRVKRYRQRSRNGVETPPDTEQTQTQRQINVVLRNGGTSHAKQKLSGGDEGRRIAEKYLAEAGTVEA